MFIVYGSRMYGKVDQIEGLGHVATEFGHIFWIPIFPKQSMLVTSEDWKGAEGVEIKLSFKSVMTAYLRAAAIIFFIAGIGAAGQLFSPDDPLPPEKVASLKTLLMISVFSVPAFIATMTPWVTTAEYDTAKALVEQAQLGPQASVFVDLSYEKIGEAEAEQRLDALESHSLESSAMNPYA